MESGSNLKIKIGESIRGGRGADVKVGNSHLRVLPVVGGGGYDVCVFSDDGHGRADTGNYLGGISVLGKPDDLEEIADTFARRLKAGIQPENLFNDIRESTQKQMKRIFKEQR